MLVLEDADHRALSEHHRRARSEGRTTWVSFVETPDPTAPRVSYVLALDMHESEAEARRAARDDAAWANVDAPGRITRVWGRVREDGGIEARGVVTRERVMQDGA